MSRRPDPVEWWLIGGLVVLTIAQIALLIWGWVR